MHKLIFLRTIQDTLIQDQLTSDEQDIGSRKGNISRKFICKVLVKTTEITEQCCEWMKDD